MAANVDFLAYLSYSRYYILSLLLLLLLVTARRLLTMRFVCRHVHALKDDADPHPRLVESALYCALEGQILCIFKSYV